MHKQCNLSLAPACPTSQCRIRMQMRRRDANTRQAPRFTVLPEPSQAYPDVGLHARQYMLQLDVAGANKTAPLHSSLVPRSPAAPLGMGKRKRQKMKIEGGKTSGKRPARGGVSARGGVGGWLLRAPVGLREGSENTLLAPSGDFEVDEARLGKPLASLDALQHPGLGRRGRSVSQLVLHSIRNDPRDTRGCRTGRTKRRGGGWG